MPDVDSASCRCKNNCQWQQYACCMLCCMLLTCQSLSWLLTLRASGWITAFPAPAGGLASTDFTTAHVEVTGQPAATTSHASQAGLATVADGQHTTTLACTNELRPAQLPFPGFPEPAQASPAEAVPIRSEVPAASAVFSPVHTCDQSKPVDSHALTHRQAHPESTVSTPSLPWQQQHECWHHQDSITRAEGHSADGEHPQGQAGAVPWFRHGLPMLVVEGQWVQPQWPAPPSQPLLKLPISLWHQQLSDLMADHPEWGASQEGRQRAVTALQQRHVADARKALGSRGPATCSSPRQGCSSHLRRRGSTPCRGPAAGGTTPCSSSLSHSPGAPSARSMGTAPRPAPPSPSPLCWGTTVGTRSLARR